MNSHLVELKDKALATKSSAGRRAIACGFLAVMCLGVVMTFWYLYLTLEELHCYKGFVSVSIVWVLAELVLIAYLFLFTNIPKFAREAISVMIACSNLWFGLFIFSLQACGS